MRFSAVFLGRTSLMLVSLSEIFECGVDEVFVGLDQQWFFLSFVVYQSVRRGCNDLTTHTMDSIQPSYFSSGACHLWQVQPLINHNFMRTPINN